MEVPKNWLQWKKREEVQAVIPFPSIRKLEPGARLRIRRFNVKPVHWSEDMMQYMGMYVMVREIRGREIYIDADRGRGQRYEGFVWSEEDFDVPI